MTIKISSPLKELEEKTIQAAEGNLDISIDSKTIESDDEIGTLAKAFMKMITNLKSRMHEIETSKHVLEQINSDLENTKNELAENEEKYHALFDTANDAILSIRNDRILDCNIRAQEIYGYSKNHLIGTTLTALSPEFQANGKKSNEIL